jgi:hypothetical protein
MDVDHPKPYPDGMSEAPTKRRFPIARKLWKFAGKALRNWRERHQNPLNFGIHLVGIPLTLVGLALLFFLPWEWGVGAFVLGYVFQWVGHLVEGNDVGELIPVKKMLGLRTVSVAPQYQRSAPPDSAA